MLQFKVKNYSWFLIALAIWVVVHAITLVVFDKASLHLALTSHHVGWLDTFFKYYTMLGEEWIYVVAVLFLFVRFQPALLIISSQLMGAGVVQIIKHIWNTPRPKEFFAQNFPDVVLHQVSDVQMHSWHSFPSGHTTAAFAFFMSLTLVYATKNKTLQLLFFMMAALVGCSRVYLSQHFSIDVLVGSVIGTMVAVLSACYWNSRKSMWLQSSLLQLLRNKLVKS